MERSDVWFIAVTAAILGFIAGMAWSNTGDQGGWLANYQTLLTGFMAVAAAFITVNAMSRSDQQQRTRHAEQMEFARGPYRLILRRVASNYPEFYGNLANEAAEIGAIVAATGRTPENIGRSIINQVWKFVQFLRVACEDDAMRQARQFFEPETESNFHFTIIINAQFEEQEVKKFLAMVLMTPTISREDSFKFFRLCDSIIDMETPLRALSEAFRDLAKEMEAR